MVEILAAVLLAVLVLEISLRLRTLWFSPWKVKIAYGLFLLGRKRLAENNVMNQRVIRGGFRSEAELLAHYSKISGKSEAESYSKFARENTLLSLLSRNYYSGGHAVFDRVQRMHVGFSARPNQKLQTLEIDQSGFRRTGWDKLPNEVKPEERVCLLLGGSTAFGLGATSDSESIAGRLAHYLNISSATKFVVVNNAMLGLNSHQELLTLLQSTHRPDFVVALSGYNELIEFTEDKVALNARQSEREWETSVTRALITIVRNFTNRSVLLAELNRFMMAFVNYDQVRTKTDDRDPDVNIYPMR